MTGPRIYNLFPLLAGPAPGWADHLERIAGMAFDWIYVNPFHYPASPAASSGQGLLRLHPLLRDGGDPETLLRGFTKAAARRALAVMMDLVINHAPRMRCWSSSIRSRSGARPTASCARRARSIRSIRASSRSGATSPRSTTTTRHAPGAGRVLGGAGRAPPEARLQGLPLRCRLPGPGRVWRPLIAPGEASIRRAASSPRRSAARRRRCWTLRRRASTICSTAPNGGTSARPGCSSSTISTARSRRPSRSPRATTPSAWRSSSAIRRRS